MNTEPDRDGPVTRWLYRGLAALNIAGALLVITLLVIINVDSLSRTLLSISFLGVTEVVELSLVAIVFLQMGDAVRSGRLTRSDGLLTLLGDRAPRLRALLHAVFDLLAAAFMALIVAGGVPRMIESYQRGEFKGTAQLFTVPEWPVKLIIVVGAIAAILAFLASAWREFRRMTQN
jgi:TRAP-type C4-dicarboxylate transport system permease small subunit